MKIEIPGPPLPWKAPYVGTRGAYSIRTPVMHQLKALVKPQWNEPVIQKSERGLRVDIDFFFEIPKSVSKKKRDLMLSRKIRPAKIPDRTNCAKFYEDLLQGIVFENDAFIVEGDIRKFYDEIPRTVIDILIL